MPIRSFNCQTCGERFELILKRDAFDTTNTAECPVCGMDAEQSGWEVPARRNPAHGLQQ